MTNASDTATTATTTEPLPEFLPIVPRRPLARPWWIPWPVAILLAPLLWLLPKRMGPHFATVRWPGVILANLIYVIYGVSCIVLAKTSPRYSWIAYALGRSPGQNDDLPLPGPTLSQIARSPLAAALNAWEAGSGGELLAQILIGMSAYIVLVLVLAVLLMPVAAAGEKKRYRYARCVKLTLWAMTSILPLGLALNAIELIYATPELTYQERLTRTMNPAMGVPAVDEKLHTWWRWTIAVYALVFLWIWLRSAWRYPGTTEGPAWPPRRPTCRQCHYQLTGLTPEDRCPECGTPVADSLATRKRRGVRKTNVTRPATGGSSG